MSTTKLFSQLYQVNATSVNVNDLAVESTSDALSRKSSGSLDSCLTDTNATVSINQDNYHNYEQLIINQTNLKENDVHLNKGTKSPLIDEATFSPESTTGSTLENLNITGVKSNIPGESRIINSNTHPEENNAPPLVTASSNPSLNPQTATKEPMEKDPLEAARHLLLKDLKSWRNDATYYKLFQSAIFWAKKIIMLQPTDIDAFKLAEIYYLAGQFQSALHLLDTFKFSKFHRRNQELASRCRKSLANASETTEFDDVGGDTTIDLSKINYNTKTIRVEAVNQFRQGQLFLKENNVNLAKQCFMKALAIDLRCYEALFWLFKLNLLSNKEERVILGDSNLFTAAIKRTCGELEEIPTVSQLPSKRFKSNNISGNIDNPIMTADKPSCSTTKRFKRNHLPGSKIKAISSPSKLLYQSANTSHAVISNSNLDFLKASYRLKFTKISSHFDEATLNENFSINDHWDALFWKAQDCCVKGFLGDAYKWLENLSKKDPTNLDCTILTLEVLFKLKRKEQLKALVQKIIEYYPHHYISLYASGLNYLSEDQIEEAQAKFRECCKAYPKFYHAWISYGYLCQDLNKAIKVFRIAAQLQPMNPKPDYCLGKIYLKIGQYSLANQHIELSSEKTNHFNPHIYNQLGLIEYKQGNFEKANSLFQMGVDYIRYKDVSECRNILVNLWVNLGKSFDKIGNLMNAEICLLNGIYFDPEATQARAELNEIYARFNIVAD